MISLENETAKQDEGWKRKERKTKIKETDRYRYKNKGRRQTKGTNIAKK